MQETLELLLPDASEDRLRTSMRWTSFMRLLCDDARSHSGERVGVDRSGALGVFEDHAGEALRELLIELLRAHLLAHLQLSGRGAFLERDRDARTPQECWSALEEFRHERRELATVPGPGESALSVARRLFASLELLAHDDPAVTVWRARLRMATASPGAGERDAAPERPLLAALHQARDRSGRAVLLAGCAELQLERGAVRAACALLGEHAELALDDDRLLELRALASLLSGDPAEARALRAARAPSTRRLSMRTPLPEAVAELRDRVPEWSELLAGERGEGPTTPAPMETLDASRGGVGAAFLAIFRIEPGGTLATRHVEISPGWRKRFDAWRADREGVCSSPSRPEHRLVATASPQIEHRLPGRPALRGALGGDETLALALWPLRDERGEIDGWVHLEFEHHLVPSRRRLESLARAWTPMGESEDRPARAALPRPAEDEELAVELRSGDPRAQFFTELVAQLGMKTAQRRWWGIVCDDRRRAIVASEGGTLDRWEARRGKARILHRALLSGGPVVTTEHDPALSICAEAASGTCLPLRVGGECIGFLVVEGERRRDFRAEDVDRYAQIAARHAPLLRAACFRSWHVERFGNDLHFEVGSEGFGRRALDFALAGRTSEPVVLSGPRGAGKETLAHWLHFESPLRDERVVVVRAGAVPAAEAEQVVESIGLEGPGVASRPGTLVVKDVVSLARPLQGKLLRALEEGQAERPRLVLTLLSTLDEAAASGALLEGLAHRLDRLQLLVPPLAERREELPGLVRMLAQRFAAERAVPPPEWEDEAVALLWRQPWPGNVRQLENLVYKLVLLHPGQSIGVDDIRDLARRFRMDLLSRIPSRHPSRHDLVAAMHTTRKQSGNPNKTRAALYLGWDPDTLATRLREAGLGDEAAEAAGDARGSADPDPD